jgi:hypothetical protein
MQLRNFCRYISKANQTKCLINSIKSITYAVQYSWHGFCKEAFTRRSDGLDFLAICGLAIDNTKVQRSSEMQGVYEFCGRSSVAACLGLLCTLSCATEIDVPEGQVLKHSFNAQGVQIYECVGSTSGVFSWTFKAPEAGLYGPDGKVAAIHYAGPTWESVDDGSKIQGQRMASSPSEATGAIPQLLLSSKVIAQGVMFGDITFIQRLNTTGGIAPESGCSANTAIKQISVPYTARYDFFTKR